MARVSYVNGRYMPHHEACVHVEDRGYQFADGVYEVIAVHRGLPVDYALHEERLRRNLRELGIPEPMSRGALVQVLKEVIRRNRVRRGMLYVQVTRGVAPRGHAFPKAMRPSVVAYARAGVGPRPQQAEEGVRVVSTPEIRWRRCDIKSVALLPNVLAKQTATEQGAFEAWQVGADGTVTEASASNAWIVDEEGRLVTRPLGADILPGVTRHVLAGLARADGIEMIERPFTLEEAKAAREAFITSTTSFVLPVVQIDDQVIGNGQPGSVASHLRALYMKHVDSVTPETAWT